MLGWFFWVPQIIYVGFYFYLWVTLVVNVRIIILMSTPSWADEFFQLLESTNSRAVNGISLLITLKKMHSVNVIKINYTLFTKKKRNNYTLGLNANARNDQWNLLHWSLDCIWSLQVPKALVWCWVLSIT